MWEKAVDALIETLANQINKGVDSGRQMIEETKALAELISARAQSTTVPGSQSQ